MPTYRNTKTGVVVDVPETPPTRTNRKGRAAQWQRHIARLDESSRWMRERPKAKPGPKPKSDEGPSSAA